MRKYTTMLLMELIQRLSCPLNNNPSNPAERHKLYKCPQPHYTHLKGVGVYPSMHWVRGSCPPCKGSPNWMLIRSRTTNPHHDIHKTHKYLQFRLYAFAFNLSDPHRVVGGCGCCHFIQYLFHAMFKDALAECIIQAVLS